MEAIHKLRIECPYEILKIEDIKIECKPNEHGYLSLKCLVDDSINFKYSIEASTEDKICIYEELENTERSIIFNGLIQNVRTTNVNGVYYLEIEAATSSFNLDEEEKSRSFQDTEMTYDDLIMEILKDYRGLGYTQCMDKPMKIGVPLFQYKETDYEFLKRIASQLGLQLICDTINPSNMFYFGRPVGTNHTLEDDIDYTACKDLKRYHKAKTLGIDFHDTDYFYYEIEKREKMVIGDQIYFNQKDLYVNQYTARFHQSELIYNYRLCRKKGIWQEKIDNIKMQGISLEGKVLEIKEQLLKLHLDIDKVQNPNKAFWFTFAPPTGNVMYSMPLVGTNALLYFKNESKEQPIVTGCVRKNGSSYSKFSDTNNRYYTTEDNNQMAMVPGSLSFMCSGNEGLTVTFDDEVGVTLKSDKNINLTATNEIIFKTETNVKIKAISELTAKKQNGQGEISLQNEMYCHGDIVHENGSCTEVYAPYIDNEITAAVAGLINSENILAAMAGANVFVSAIGNKSNSKHNNQGITVNNNISSLSDILQGKPNSINNTTPVVQQSNTNSIEIVANNSINNLSGPNVKNSTSTNDLRDYYIGAGETPGVGQPYKDGDGVSLKAQTGEEFAATVDLSEPGGSVKINDYEGYNKANYDPDNLIPKTGVYAVADVAQETLWGGLKLVTYVPEEWEAFVDQSGLTYHLPGSWESTRESFDKISSNWHNYLYDKAPRKDLFYGDKFAINLVSSLYGIRGIIGSIKNIPKLFNGGLKVAAFANGTFSIAKAWEINVAAIAGIGKIGAYGLGTGAVINNMMGDSDRAGDAGDDFTGWLRKEKVELPGVKTKDINYVKREYEEAEKLRKAFNSTEKKKFLKNFAEDVEKLKRAGLSDSDISRMKDGLNPKGWQVHHKLPLDDGGTNVMDNLIMIKNEPYHKTITNFQNTFAKQLSPGETKIVKWPIPEGNIYPPNN